MDDQPTAFIPADLHSKLDIALRNAATGMREIKWFKKKIEEKKLNNNNNNN